VEIGEKVNEIYGVKGVGDVKIRQSGPFRMVECRIETSPTLPLYRAHELADKVEDFIADRYTNIESVFVHVEPAREKVMTAIVPVRDIRNLDSRVHGHFGRSPYFIILKLQEGKAEIEDFYMNPYLKDKIHVGIKVIKAVIRYKLDILFTPQIGELSFYMLKDNFVDIYRAEEGESVRDLLQRFLTQSLTPVTAPTHKLEDSAIEGED
jgi:predicted Fe-Mo cluster-binding NifX family protein